MAELALQTRQSPYDLARLLDEFPLVFRAYRERAQKIAEAAREPKSETFRERRERTREQRIRRTL